MLIKRDDPKDFWPHGRIVWRLFCALYLMTTRDSTFFASFLFWRVLGEHLGRPQVRVILKKISQQSYTWLAGQQVASRIKSWVSDFGLWMSAKGLSEEVKELSSEGSRSKAKDKALQLLWWPPPSPFCST